MLNAGAIALALIGALFAISGVETLIEIRRRAPVWSVSSLFNIAFGLFSLFVAVRSYRKTSP